MRITILMLLAISLAGCVYPGIQNWTRSQHTETQRDTEYRSCVQVHVYQHGANEGLTHSRDYTYRPEAAVWDCMAGLGYVWRPDAQFGTFIHPTRSAEQQQIDYETCFQKHPYFDNWQPPLQRTTMAELSTCMTAQGYRFRR